MTISAMQGAIVRKQWRPGSRRSGKNLARRADEKIARGIGLVYRVQFAHRRERQTLTAEPAREGQRIALSPAVSDVKQTGRNAISGLTIAKASNQPKPAGFRLRHRHAQPATPPQPLGLIYIRLQSGIA